MFDGLEGFCLHDDTGYRQDHTKRAPVGDRSAAHDPAERDDGAGLDVPHDGAADGAGAGDDEELREIDEGREGAAEENHHPLGPGHCVEGGQLVRPRDHDHQHRAANGRLVEEQLEAVQVVLALVRRDPDGVDGADEDARQREEDAEQVGLLGFRVACGLGLVVGDDEDAQAHGQ